MRKLLLLLGILGCPATAAADDLQADLWIDAKGGSVEIDISALKSVIPSALFPKDATGFRIAYSNASQRIIPKADQWKIKVENVTAQQGKGKNEIALSHQKLNLRIVFTIRAVAARNFEARWTKVLGTESATISSCNLGQEPWKLKNDPGLSLTTTNGLAVNTVNLSGKNALASTPVSGYYIIPRTSLQPWIAVAKRYYAAICDSDWDAFVACYNKFDQRNANRYATCQLHWRAAQRLVQNQKVSRYDYDRTDQRQSTDKMVKMFFKRMRKGKNGGKDEQVGYALPIRVKQEGTELIDGKQVVKWVVATASQ